MAPAINPFCEVSIRTGGDDLAVLSASIPSPGEGYHAEHSRDPNPPAPFGSEFDSITVPISTKKQTRKELFKKLGAAISAMKQGDPDVSDYYTGRASCFKIANGASQDPELLIFKGVIGPKMKTPQWVRTIK